MGTQTCLTRILDDIEAPRRDISSVGKEKYCQSKCLKQMNLGMEMHINMRKLCLRFFWQQIYKVVWMQKSLKSTEETIGIVYRREGMEKRI